MLCCYLEKGKTLQYLLVCMLLIKGITPIRAVMRHSVMIFSGTALPAV